MSMTYDEVIYTCRICGKQKREPWYPIAGWSRPPKPREYFKRNVI